MMRLVASWTGFARALSSEVRSETLETDPCLPCDIPTVFNSHSLVLTALSQSVSSLPAGLTGPTGVLSDEDAVRVQDAGGGSAFGGMCGWRRVRHARYARLRWLAQLRRHVLQRPSDFLQELEQAWELVSHVHLAVVAADSVNPLLSGFFR